MKRYVVFGVFTLVVSLAAFALFSAIFKTTAHKVATVTTGKAKETVYATGFVETIKMREIRSQRSGVVAQVFADEASNQLTEGSIVKAGQAILKLRDTGRESVKAAAKAELERVMTQMEKGSAFRQSFESRIEEAEQTAIDLRAREGRLKKQYDIGNISKDSYDSARTKAVVAEEVVSRIKEDMRQALADLESNRAAVLSKYEVALAAEEDDTIRSPIDGRILQLPIKEGEFAKSGQLLLKVGDTREYHIEAEVNEDDIASVAVGKPVLIRLAGAEKQFEGQVKEILPDADRATKSFVVRVSFNKLSNPEPDNLGSKPTLPNGQNVYSGMTVELGIVVSEKLGVMVIPRAALVRDNFVFVVSDGRVSKKKVQIGLTNFSNVEIQEGLEVGQMVVTTDINKLKDGQRISVIE